MGTFFILLKRMVFQIAFKVPLLLDSSKNSKIMKSMAIALEEFGKYFEDNKYDLLIILGGRYCDKKEELEVNLYLM